MTATRPLSPAVSARSTLTLDQIDELVRAYGFRPTVAGDTVLTSERKVGDRIQVLAFIRAGGAGIGWHASFFVHAIDGIAEDGTPKRTICQPPQESGMLLTLSGAQDFLARLG